MEPTSTVANAQPVNPGVPSSFKIPVPSAASVTGQRRENNPARQGNATAPGNAVNSTVDPANGGNNPARQGNATVPGNAVNSIARPANGGNNPARQGNATVPGNAVNSIARPANGGNNPARQGNATAPGNAVNSNNPAPAVNSTVPGNAVNSIARPTSRPAARAATGNAVNSTDQEAPSKRFHWFIHHDVLLLKQMLEVEPYAATHGQKQKAWETIAQALQFGISTNAYMKRFHDTLLPNFRKQESESLRASGTVEEQNEYVQLMTELEERMREVEEVGEEKKKGEEKEKALGLQVRDDALVRMKQKRRKISEVVEENNEEEERESSPKKNKNEETIFMWMEWKKQEAEKNRKLEEERLALEKEKAKLELEKMKAELESKNEVKKLSQDVGELKKLMQLLADKLQ